MSSSASIQQQDVLDSLAELYAALKEEDLWAGLWQKRAKFPETNLSIAYELQGYYEKAQVSLIQTLYTGLYSVTYLYFILMPKITLWQGVYELAMGKAKGDASKDGVNCFSELKLWEDHWVK